MISNIIQPGLLVSLKTSIRGNVDYQKIDIEAEHGLEDGSRRAKWETTRTVADPNEHQRAVEVRGRCRTLITRVCTGGNFMLCPQVNEPLLERAIAESRQLADSFNATAKLSHIGIYVVVGRVAQNDIELVRSVRSELSDFIADMEEGIKKLDGEAIRKAANELTAEKLTRILSPEAAARVEDTIKVARATAKQLIKASETAAGEVDEAALRFLRQSSAMLDLSEAAPVSISPTPISPALDLELPLFKPPKPSPRNAAAMIEL